MNFYRILFSTKHGMKQFRTWYFIDVSATSKKNALEIAKNLWYQNHKKHMFALSAERLHSIVLAEYFSLCEQYDVKSPF